MSDWIVIDIRKPTDFLEAWELAMEGGGEDNTGFRAPEMIAVKDDVLAVQIKLAFG